MYPSKFLHWKEITPPVEEGEKVSSKLLLHHTSGIKSSPPPIIHAVSTSSPTIGINVTPSVLGTHDRYVTSSSSCYTATGGHQTEAENLSKAKESVTDDVISGVSALNDNKRNYDDGHQTTDADNQMTKDADSQQETDYTNSARLKNISGLVSKDSYRLLPEILMPPPPVPRH